MTLRHPEYAHGILTADLIAEAREFCTEELDSFEGMDFDSDSEVCCQRSNTFIRELADRLECSGSVNLLDLLIEVRNACLFDDDDGQIGVSEEPTITHDLFDRICAAINSGRPAPHGNAR